MKPTISKKRVYETPTAEDGLRVLADRLWPRGVTKESAQIDLWPQSLAPSTALRRWFHEDPSRLQEFEKKYRQELEQNIEEYIPLIESLRQQSVVTLVSAVKDLNQGHVETLKRFLDDQL